MIDNNDKQWFVEVVGFDITSEIKDMDMTEIASVLGVHLNQVERPSRKSDLLFGSDYCVLILKLVNTAESLELMLNEYGNGNRNYLGP